MREARDRAGTGSTLTSNIDLLILLYSSIIPHHPRGIISYEITHGSYDIQVYINAILKRHFIICWLNYVGQRATNIISHVQI